MAAQKLAGVHIELEYCHFDDCREPKFDLVLDASKFEDLFSNTALGPHCATHDDTIESIFHAPPLVKIPQIFMDVATSHPVDRPSKVGIAVQ